jgi:hypothetical protein
MSTRKILVGAVIIVAGLFLLSAPCVMAQDFPRFTDNGDGTVYDRKTDLMWLKDPYCLGDHLWQDAMEEAAGLMSGACGLSDGSYPGDWRLPTVGEWEEFACPQYEGPAVCNTEGTGQWSVGDPFDYMIPEAAFWTSEGGFLYVNMYGGEITEIGIGYDIPYDVWPVRDSLSICMDGETKECGKTDVGACQYGTRTCINGQWGACVGEIRPQEELCDGLDKDCDGYGVDIPDIECECLDGETRQCGETNVGACEYGTEICINGQWTDCDAIFPTEEVCGSGDDEDCDWWLDNEDPDCCYYVDNGDGTVSAGGVKWLKDANCWGLRTRKEAERLVGQLQDGQCGLMDGSKPGDWYLPAYNDLWRLGTEWIYEGQLIMFPNLLGCNNDGGVGISGIWTENDKTGFINVGVGRRYWTATWTQDYFPPWAEGADWAEVNMFNFIYNTALGWRIGFTLDSSLFGLGWYYVWPRKGEPDWDDRYQD